MTRFVRIVLRRNHICRVSSQCVYGHVSPNHHLLRILHHRHNIRMVSPQGECVQNCPPQVSHLHLVYHISRVSPQCAYGHVSSKYRFLRTVHHKYHIYRVSHQCGYGNVSSNYILLRIVTTGITFFSPVWLWTCAFKLHLNENCESQVSHL